MMLLKTSSKKKTRWWFWTAENRNQVVEKASKRCSNLLAATMERDFRYGDTVEGKQMKTRERTKVYLFSKIHH